MHDVTIGFGIIFEYELRQGINFSIHNFCYVWSVHISIAEIIRFFTCSE